MRLLQVLHPFVPELTIIRRLKCDRRIPCETCSKRGEAFSCKYSKAVASEKERSNDESGASEIQLRLQKLESMVTNFIETGGKGSLTHEFSPSDGTEHNQLKSNGAHSPSEAARATPNGHLEVNGRETTYLGATHWATILENVGGDSPDRSSTYLLLTSLRSKRYKVLLDPLKKKKFFLNHVTHVLT